MKRIYVVYLDSRDEYCQFFGVYSELRKAQQRVRQLEKEYPRVDYEDFTIDENIGVL